MTPLQMVAESTAFLNEKIKLKPTIGCILGSGLGDLADHMTEAVVIPYETIPHFPVSTVEGHAGHLVVGSLGGKSVAIMKGRFHYYEGYSMQAVTYPIRVMKALGISSLIVTNACGGLNPSFHAGGLMLISDHLNLTGDNPLIGANVNEWGPRFPDLSNAYDASLRKKAGAIAQQLNIDLFEGVYASISGPNYMARAELAMLTYLGADVVGMSTAPEVIVANHAEIRVLGISCITDMAIPDSLVSISHEEVMAVAEKTKPTFIKLVKQIIEEAF
ncbi:purine-nucleoside phosphorylase [Anoxynatronum buryatiense]|nr:purine-nucleoside phosphorylase [Anoxynatronum buryatiense]